MRQVQVSVYQARQGVELRLSLAVDPKAVVPDVMEEIEARVRGEVESDLGLPLQHLAVRLVNLQPPMTTTSVAPQR